MNAYEFLPFFDMAGVGLLLAIGALAALGIRHWTSRWFQQVCSQVGDVPSTCALNGRDVAVRLLKACGLGSVPVLSFGTMDCYHPWKRQVRLRPPTYNSASVSALAIAAHEVGHAQQFSDKIWRSRLRNILWPVCWSLPVVAAIVAILLVMGDTHLSPHALVVGALILCALVVVLQLPITLPLERDASQRAKKLARENGFLAKHEEAAFDRVLGAAWKTHVSGVVQRWIVLAVLALVMAGVPLYQSSLGSRLGVPPEFDALVDREALKREAAAKPVPAVQQPPADPLDLDDDEDAPEGWRHLLWLMPISPTLLLSGVILMIVLARSKQSGHKKVTREGKAVLRNNAGSALYKKGQYDAAIAEFSRALELNPRLTIAWYNRGSVYVAMGRHEESLHDFDAASRLAPHYLDALAARGQARLLLGQHELGLADLDLARAQNPTNINVLSVQSDFFQRRGDFERAIAVWSDAINAAPENGDFHRTRGLMYYFHENFDRAINDESTAIRLNPADALARNNRGAALLKRGEWAAARDDLREAIKLDPKLPNSFRHLAWLQATCPEAGFRSGTEAVSNATRALELTDWKRHEWYDVLAAAYAEAGNFEQAVHWQQKGLDAAAAESKAVYEERLNQYRNGQAFREKPSAPADSASGQKPR